MAVWQVTKTEDRRLLLYQAELGAETAARVLRFDQTGEMEPFDQTVTFADTGVDPFRLLHGGKTTSAAS